jgi:hypothetical protein
MTKTVLQQKIMRRVYYAYTLAVASQPLFWQGMLLGACTALFGRLTHVASLVNNVLALPLGNVPRYAFDAVATALTHGEVFTVLVTVFMVLLGFSVATRLIPLFITLRKIEV